MSERPVPAPTARDWSDALLTSGSEALHGAVRNYIGPIKTPYDKRDLVARLEAFLRRSETRESLLALLDPLDIRILGSSLLLGPVHEQALKDLFVGELPLFELGVRLANLLDRLLLFRYLAGGRRLIAVNPILEDELQARAFDPVLFFGAGTLGALSGGGEGPLPAVDAATAIALFSYFFHAPSSTRKGGGLTKRAAERAAALLPELSSGSPERLAVLARALSAAGALRVGEGDERCPDRRSFALMIEKWGERLPYFLAASLVGEGSGVGGAPVSLALILAGGLEALPEGIALPRAALSRWLRIVARRAPALGHSLAADPADAISPLEDLGILATREGRLVLAPRRKPAPSAPATAGALVVEGSHALHLMPEASLEDRLFVGCVARPVTVGTVWSFEVERDTARRAFAAGLAAPDIRARFESMSGAPLPQSFVFSLSAWEEEYRSLRLYRGFALAADERQRLVIERSASLGRIVAERLGPGLYFLSVATLEEAVEALAAAGLEAPPLIQAGAAPAAPAQADAPGGAASTAEATPVRSAIDALRDLVGTGRFAAGRPGPEPELRLAALRAALAASGRTEEERREIAERIEGRLVLTERQIAHSDPRSERLEAGGLDYLGKVRVIERALRSTGDRLEVLYRLPGEEPVRALLRPVKLDKNDKGLVLEAEDLGTGGPARVPLGAVSTVRRLRASLFGEDQ